MFTFSEKPSENNLFSIIQLLKQKQGLNEERDLVLFNHFFDTHEIAKYIHSIDDLLKLFELHPSFAAFVCLEMQTTLIRSWADLEKIAKTDRSLIGELLQNEEIATFATIESLQALRQNHVHLNFKNDFARYSDLLIKKLIKTDYVYSMLDQIDIDSENAHLVYKSEEARNAINTGLKFRLLGEKNPQMAVVLVESHPAIVIMLLKTKLDEKLFEELINYAIHHDIFKDPKIFLEIARVNWKHARKLADILEIYNKVKPMLSLAFFGSLSHAHGFDDKECMSHQLKTQPLDLEVKQESIEKPLRERRKIQIAENFFLFSDFFSEMMFGKSGYYTSKIEFIHSSDEKTGDYSTLPSKITSRKIFAAGMLYQLFNFRKNMIEQGILKSDAPFNVLECGGGEGHLCLSILELAEGLKTLYPDSEWSDFFDHLHYTLLEISPDLLARQKNTTLPYHTKISFVQGNAIYAKRYFTEPSFAAVISNELPDMFPNDIIYRDVKGTPRPFFFAPTINEKDYLLYFEKPLDSQFLTELKKESAKYKEMLEPLLDDKSKKSPAFKDNIILSKKNFLKLHQYYAEDKRFAPQDDVTQDLVIFDFLEIPIECHYFPKLHQFIQQHPEMILEKEQLICPAIQTFLENISQVLMDKGFVLTVDYGGADSEFNHHVRTYYQRQRGYDFFRAPGYMDMTTDVRFTGFVEIAKKYGLATLVYDLQQKVLTANCIEFFKKTKLLDETLIENFMQKRSGFKLCIQSKTAENKPRPANAMPVTQVEEINFPKRKEELVSLLRNPPPAANFKKISTFLDEREPIWGTLPDLEPIPILEDKKLSNADLDPATTVSPWMMNFEKMLPRALKREKETIVELTPHPFLSSTEEIELLIKKMLDQKTPVSFFHHSKTGDLFAEWPIDSEKNHYVNVTAHLRSANLSQIILTNEEMNAFVDYIRSTKNSSPDDHYFQAREQKRNKSKLALGEKISLNQFTGKDYKDINSFLSGKGHRDLECWKNLNEVTFQRKVKDLLFACVIGTHGLKRIHDFPPRFHLVRKPPESKDISSNDFYIKPSSNKDTLFSYFYKTPQDKVNEVTVQSSDLDKLYEPLNKTAHSPNVFAQEQILKLFRVIDDGDSHLLKDDHLQTFLKDLLRTNDITSSALIRFEKFADKKNPSPTVKSKIDAHQSGSFFRGDRFMSSIRFAEFNKPAHQNKLAKLIEDNDIYLLIYSERNRLTIRSYSQIQEEEEVLFPPDAKFIVLDYIKDEKGKYYFILKEMDGLSASIEPSKTPCVGI